MVQGAHTIIKAGGGSAYVHVYLYLFLYFRCNQINSIQNVILHHCVDQRGVLCLAVVSTLALFLSPCVPLGTCLDLDSPWLRALDITDVDLY